MKMPIAWHERNLANYRYSLQVAERELAQMETRVNEMKAEIQHRKETIARAKQEGCDAYDAETYNKQRRAK